MKQKTAGFTLLELLVVLAIIGLLSTVVFGSLGDAKNKSREVVALKEIRRLNEAIFIYELDTSTRLECSSGICTSKLYTNPGISGWDGPYFEESSHPWGGKIEIEKRSIGVSITPETLIYLTNDRLGFDATDNRAKIPQASMLSIDKSLDDGNLNTGSIRKVNDADERDEGQLLIRPSITNQTNDITVSP